jgi:hypothetical protein
MDPAERVTIAEASDGLIDPRIAKRGGYRTNPKHGYDFPGMAADSDWRKTDVHKATAWYGCALCGTKFTGPHAVYTHLARVHDR